MNNFFAHILLVDDDEGIRLLVKKYLNENKYLVTTAINAEDAYEKAKVIKFDLININFNDLKIILKMIVFIDSIFYFCDRKILKNDEHINYSYCFPSYCNISSDLKSWRIIIGS